MNYVFYETGNDPFFKRIANVFSNFFMWYIFINVFNQVLQPGGRAIDKTRGGKLEKVANSCKSILKTLNCALFPAVRARCGNNQCKENHKIVLVTDQLAVFETEMKESKDALIGNKDYIKDSKVRFNMQELLENFKVAAFAKDMYEHIVINPQSHPGQHSIDYKNNYHADYMKAYFRQAKEIGTRTGTENCVYVRAETNSDYAVFESNMKSPGVTITPCDEFQGI